jgi:hypothetical protein
LKTLIAFRILIQKATPFFDFSAETTQ